jgi:carboxylesterase type B
MTDLQEGTLFVFAQYESNLGAATAEVYDTYLQQTYGTNAPRIKEQYPLSAFNSTAFPPIYAISQIVTAASFLCPARRGLDVAAKNGIPVWTYRFSHSPKCSWEQKIPDYGVSLLGATHSSELPFVFGHTSALPPPNGTCEMTDDEKNISAFMTKAWTSMAEQQKPGDDSDWPAWSDASKSLGVNIVNSSEPGFVNYTECKLWDDINSMMTANSTNNGSSTTNGSSSTTAPSGPAKTSGTSGAATLSVNMVTVVAWAMGLAVFAFL